MEASPYFRYNTLDEMTVGRTEKPSASSRTPQKPADPGVITRAKPGIGSYEEAGDVRREKRRPGKTGRPGR